MNPYLKAAKLVFAGEPRYSCWAVMHACSLSNEGAGTAMDKAMEYARVFAPAGALSHTFWLRDILDVEERREWRLTALCLAAAMHETGDL